ncbi:MAG: pilus assembly protein N-terminal domain-containing protein [Hyphomicrobiaceae bacterium]|nr:pilus assembly protein N-terminal domain-containing protein [Hyphomicrobiaceae bacterium]
MLYQNIKRLFALERILISILFSILSLSLFTSSTAVAEPITVFIDEAKIVELSRPIAQVIIGNPAIADVTIQSKKMLVFTGKSTGHTNIILLDEDNRQILNKKVHVTTSKESGLVIVYRGRSRNSYHCGTVCNGTVNLGDSTKFTTNVLSATDARLKSASKAAKGN